jgi:hypothetical protein
MFCMLVYFPLDFLILFHNQCVRTFQLKSGAKVADAEAVKFATCALSATLKVIWNSFEVLRPLLYVYTHVPEQLHDLL